jgi:hypothetical protein
MKEELCRAFCDDIRIREVPAGLAVSTVFGSGDGDRIGFFVVESGANLRIEDDGLTLPSLEASGVDFKSGTRAQALEELKSEYGVSVDQENHEFFIDGLAASDLPHAAFRFVAFSLRLRDFMLMTEHRVASTFREDAAKLIREVIGPRASVEEDAAILPDLSDFPADFVLRAPGRQPVGVYLGSSDHRVLEALFVHSRARHETLENCSIVALLESSKGVSAKIRQLAANRLDAVPEFRGAEVAAIERIAEEAFGPSASLH